MNGKINSQGIKYMDTWQDIGGSICPIDLSHQSCKDVASGKYCRTEMLNVRIDVGNNKENRHSHHQVEDQLEIFLFILIAKQEIHNRHYHIWKPQKVRNNKNLAERDHIIKNSMYNMVGSYRPVLQISKQDKIGNEIDRYDKTVPVFFYLTQHFAAPFLEVWLMSALSFFFVKYLPATITQAL